jgi:hypothetical protein
MQSGRSGSATRDTDSIITHIHDLSALHQSLPRDTAIVQKNLL